MSFILIGAFVCTFILDLENYKMYDDRSPMFTITQQYPIVHFVKSLYAFSFHTRSGYYIKLYDYYQITGYSLFQKKRTFNSDYFRSPPGEGGPKIRMLNYVNGSSIHAQFFSLENLQPFLRYLKKRGSMSQNKNCSFHKSP